MIRFSLKLLVINLFLRLPSLLVAVQENLKTEKIFSRSLEEAGFQLNNYFTKSTPTFSLSL